MDRLLFAPLFALLFAAPPAAANPLHLSASVRGEVAAGGAGGGTQLALRWAATDWLAVDAIGRVGYVGARGADDTGYLALIAGPTWIYAVTDDWQARLGVRFAHIHHATAESWAGTPVSNVVGDSSGGVRHRSGLEVALGALGGALWRDGGSALVWDLELAAGLLPSSDELAWTAGLAVGLAAR